MDSAVCGVVEVMPTSGVKAVAALTSPAPPTGPTFFLLLNANFARGATASRWRARRSLRSLMA